MGANIGGEVGREGEFAQADAKNVVGEIRKNSRKNRIA